MYVSDALSRAYLMRTDNDACLEREAEYQVHSVVKNLPASNDIIMKIKSETLTDPVLQSLIENVKNGWPDIRKNLEDALKPYWQDREELHVAHGLLMKQNRIVMPTSLQQQMLDRIHEGHLGIELCKRRARESLFWPGISAQIEDKVSKCGVCQKHQRNQTREPMIPHEIPDGPWQSVSTDLFQVHGTNYVLIVDVFSGYPEISLLNQSTASEAVINALKSTFARHGIPNTVFSDNGPQYSSHKFAEFAKTWGFIHDTSSPTYAQSNGLAERYVQTIKNLLIKALETGEDPYIALLAYRSTPRHDMKSPAEILMGRKLKTRLPMITDSAQTDTKQTIKIRSENEKTYYDKRAKPLQPLHSGQSVRIRRNSAWEQATVANSTQYPRSYDIQMPEGQTYRRNRKDILRIPENSKQMTSEVYQNDPRDGDMTESIQIPDSTQSQEQGENLRRSDRVRRMPEHLKDYVLSK